MFSCEICKIFKKICEANDCFWRNSTAGVVWNLKLVYCQKQPSKHGKKNQTENFCRISDNLFKSFIFADFRRYWHIQTPVRHLIFLQKYIKPLTFFIKVLSWTHNLVPNTPLAGLVQNVPRRELELFFATTKGTRNLFRCRQLKRTDVCGCK